MTLLALHDVEENDEECLELQPLLCLYDWRLCCVRKVPLRNDAACYIVELFAVFVYQAA